VSRGGGGGGLGSRLAFGVGGIAVARATVASSRSALCKQIMGHPAVLR
jgi:hypothetical protein